MPNSRKNPNKLGKVAPFFLKKTVVALKNRKNGGFKKTGKNVFPNYEYYWQNKIGRHNYGISFWTVL